MLVIFCSCNKDKATIRHQKKQRGFNCHVFFSEIKDMNQGVTETLKLAAINQYVHTERQMRFSVK